MIRRANFIFLAVICVFVIVEILVLRPASTERAESASTGMFDSIEEAVKAAKYKDEIGYTIEGFHYTAVEGEEKHWELRSKEAILYEKSRVMRAQQAHIKMFDSEGKITNIYGDEADYKMGVKDLDLRGNVKVLFPDGFWITTTKAHYGGAQGLITSAEPFHGQAKPKSGSSKGASELMEMWGVGFDTTKTGPEVHIHGSARVRMRRLDNDEVTDVRSDVARVDRFGRIAYFSMANPANFVVSNQGTLNVQSRRQEATYDSDSAVVKYMAAFDDVTIREMDPKRSREGLKYATGQRADFLTHDDKILLSGFPSAYQEHDTLTGELITIYRKKNLVEVTETNAYHEGQDQK